MLDKLKFNNLVITNKKLIQQARAQSIAKLVQKLRKVKDALEKQPDSEKHKQRLRKSVECMIQMKSLKPLHIMRSILVQDTQRHKAVLTNGRATPDEIAIAVLGLNKVMEGLKVKFQQELNLSSKADAGWRQEILETSKRRLKMDRTEDKRLKRKGLKEQKALSRKRLEWLEQNKPVDQELESTTTEARSTETSVCTVEVLKTPKPEKKVSKMKNQDKPNRVAKEPKTEKLPKTLRSLPKANENGQKSVIKREPDESKLNNKQNKPKKEEKERPTHVIDPFFITDSGQPYLSTAVVLSDDSHNESDNEEPQIDQRRRNPINSRRQFREQNRQEFSGTNHREFTEKQSDNRHPSWIAKEQKKPVITNFKGKKIKFSDDGSAAETILPAPKPLLPVVDSQSDMHPSWVAKQKLKPKIATFTGTKIKFDD